MVKNTNKMKVVLSGSFSVGKTSLLDAIENSKQFEDCVLIREVVRTLAKQGVQINKGADNYSQCRILEQHYKNTLLYDNMITDRGAIDAFVFATYDFLQGNYSYEEHKHHEKMFLDTIKYYDWFFYIPIEFELVDDGFRSLDKEYQKDIDILFKQVFKRYKVNYFALGGTVAERFQTFANVLQHA